jgi:uncharacterized RDD family membrane protein YckC
MEDYNLKFDPEAVGGQGGQAEEPAEGPVPAGFSERFLAYFVDTAPFVAGAPLSYSFLNGTGAAVYLPSELKWKLMWIAAYVLYETALTSGGRATVGKLLLGLRVRSSDGSELSVPRAFLRAIAYFISSAPLNLGYLLALATPGNRALHDYISGTRVVSVSERGENAGIAIAAVSWALMAMLTGTWVKHNFIDLTPSEKRQVELARTTVAKVATLEEIHKRKYGAYTEDMKRLAALTGNPVAVRNEIIRTIEPDTLSLATNGRDYIITARARNWHRTTVSMESGPRQ